MIDVEQGGLPGPVRTDQCQNFPFPHRVDTWVRAASPPNRFETSWISRKLTKRLLWALQNPAEELAIIADDSVGQENDDKAKKDPE